MAFSSKTKREKYILYWLKMNRIKLVHHGSEERFIPAFSIPFDGLRLERIYGIRCEKSSTIVLTKKWTSVDRTPIVHPSEYYQIINKKCSAMASLQKIWISSKSRVKWPWIWPFFTLNWMSTFCSIICCLVLTQMTH